MKLVRYGEKGAEKPGMVDADGTLRDLSGVIADVNGDNLDPGTLDRLRALDTTSLPAVSGDPRMGPCVGNVGTFFCIGLNYSDHAAETGAKVPDEPILFLKATSAINGPNDDIVMPRGSEKTDWEVELTAVIGTAAKYVTKEQALDHVAGYCVANDVSERHWQTERSGQWTKGKSPDTYGPIGPWLVTGDEVGDPQNLDMSVDVNGERKQTGNSRTQIFPIAEIIAHLSQFITLHPGDVIATGTPPGVGMGMNPQQFLKVGDEVVVTIEKLGQQRAKVRMDD